MTAEGTVDLSVVIATYNGSTTLGEQLEALAGQKSSIEWEVVIADNGSTDSTRELALSYSDRLHVRVVDASESRGQCFARNVGVREAAGRLILFLDQDDVVAPGYLEAMMEGLARWDMVGARIDSDSLNPGWIAKSRRPAQVASLGQALGYLPYAGGQTLGIHRTAFDRVGGFDDAMPGAVEDVDLCWRVQRAGFSLGYVPDAIVLYRYRPSLRSQLRQAFAYGRAEATLYSRYRKLGMQRRSTRQALLTWAIWGRNIIRVRNKGDVAKLAWKLSHDLGMAFCCIRMRIYYP